MKNNIYKYPLNLAPHSTVLRIEGFVRILAVQVTQGDNAFVWVESNPLEEQETLITLNSYLTGEGSRDDAPREMYLGSLFYHGGSYIEHVYVTLQ